MFFLGIADMIAASLLTRGFYEFPLPKIIIIVFAGYLILKAIIFIADIASFVDLGAGIVLLLSLSVALPPVLLFVLAFFLGIKGIATLFGSFHF